MTGQQRARRAAAPVAPAAHAAARHCGRPAGRPRPGARPHGRPAVHAARVCTHTRAYARARRPLPYSWNTVSIAAVLPGTMKVYLKRPFLVGLCA